MQYNCPRDSHQLVQQPPEIGAPWHCNICSGAFFTDLVRKEVATYNLALGPREEWDREVICPRDAVPMRKVVVGAGAFDCCLQCDAAWLDGDEVDRLWRTPVIEHQKKASGLSEADWLTPLVTAAIGALAGGH